MVIDEYRQSALSTKALLTIHHCPLSFLSHRRSNSAAQDHLHLRSFGSWDLRLGRLVLRKVEESWIAEKEMRDAVVVWCLLKGILEYSRVFC